VLVPVVAVVVFVDAAVVVVASVVLVVVLGGAELAVELVPPDAAGVPPELPQALRTAAPSAMAASSGSDRFMRRCSGIDISGPSRLGGHPFPGPLVACQYPGRRHGP
jgi:hypothetical protein